MAEQLNFLGTLYETVERQGFITPFDDPSQALKDFLARAAVAGAKLRTMIYGCTWAPYFDALIAAKAAGADVRVIFDHTQAAGPKEREQVQRLVAAGFVDGTHFLIGTSPVQHQIVHLKRTAIWTPDGKCYVEHGSFNYSDSAFKQLNDINIDESVNAGHFTEMAFDWLWNWVQLHEKAYQLGATK